MKLDGPIEVTNHNIRDLVADENPDFIQKLMSPRIVKEIKSIDEENACLTGEDLLDFSITNYSFEVASYLIKSNIYNLFHDNYKACKTIMMLTHEDHDKLIDIFKENCIFWEEIISQIDNASLYVLYYAAKNGHLHDLQLGLSSKNLSLSEKDIRSLLTYAFLGYTETIEESNNGWTKSSLTLEYLYTYYRDKIGIGNPYLDDKILLCWEPKKAYFFLDTFEQKLLLNQDHPIRYLDNNAELLLSILNKTPTHFLDTYRQTFCRTVREILKNSLEADPSQLSASTWENLKKIRHKVLKKLLEINNYYLLDSFFSFGFADFEQINEDKECSALIYKADYAVRELFLNRSTWDPLTFNPIKINLSHGEVESYRFQIAYAYVNKILKTARDNPLNVNLSLRDLYNRYVDTCEPKKIGGLYRPVLTIKDRQWNTELLEGFKETKAYLKKVIYLTESWVKEEIDFSDMDIDLSIRKKALFELFHHKDDLCSPLVYGLAWDIIDDIKNYRSFEKIQEECIQFWLNHQYQDSFTMKLDPITETVLHRVEILFSHFKSLMVMNYVPESKNLALFSWLHKSNINKHPMFTLEPLIASSTACLITPRD